MIPLPPTSTLFPYTTLFRSILAQGMSSVWLTGSAMTVALLMIVGLLALVVILGGQTFWPRPLIEVRSEEHTSELQSLTNLVCRLLLEKKKTTLSLAVRPRTA